MMTLQHKPVWAEGMLIQPQHFQQQERYLEWRMDRKASLTHNFNYGFHQLTIDQGLLEASQFAISQAQGMFADGTVFDLPAMDALPEPIVIDEAVTDEIIYLILPLVSYSILVSSTFAEKVVPVSVIPLPL